MDPRSADSEGKPGKEIWIGKEANDSKRGYKALFCGDKVVSVGFGR
jgi:hypothetical protein